MAQKEALLLKKEKELELREAQLQGYHQQQQQQAVMMQPTTPKMVLTGEADMMSPSPDYAGGVSWKQPPRQMNRMNSLPNIGGLNLSGGRPGKENAFS